MAWANVAFRGSRYSDETVYYASRIAGLPVLTLLVWLVVRDHRRFLRGLFSTEGLTIKIVLTSVAVGLLARVFWWSQVVARVSFGWLQQASAAPPQPLSFSFSCPEPAILLMAILVWCFLVPFTEEFVHRGVLLSALSDRGPVLSVAASALFFAAMHRPQSFLFVFLFGVLFGILFWNARTLWAPLIAHATYDGIIILDWYCLNTSWTPAPEKLPQLALGTAAGTVAMTSLIGITYLIGKRWIGLRPQPNPGTT